MIVVKRETTDAGTIGVCEQCKQSGIVRPVEVTASAFGGAGRGWYTLCYNCHRPRVFWRKSVNDQTVYESPA